MNKIVKLIENEAWDDAMDAFLNHTETMAMDTDAYIIGATLMEHYQKYDTMFSFISEGLKSAPTNYELYILLGNYFSISNADQAYLSYENALYYCIESGNSNDADYIKRLIIKLKENNTVSVRNLSFIILSYNTLYYTKICIESIRNTCYNKIYEIIVVDNASTDESVEWLRDQNDIILIENKENIGFPAGCNQGINAAYSGNDIFLLNNDTVLLPNSLFWLRIGLYKDIKTGASGAMTNYAINDQTIKEQFETIEDYISFGTAINTPMLNPYELKAFLMMFAMLIKRPVLDYVGLLDERFTPGNFEDNDYGLRLMENGYNCVLCHNCFIYHFGSKSFSKDKKVYIDLFWRNRDKLKDKWGFYDDYYTHARSEVIDLIDSPYDSNISILEIGCGLGETLARIKYLYPNAEVHGIEIVESIAAIGGNRLDIQCGDIENMIPYKREYDYILFPDVIEHLKEPGDILLKMQTYLKKGGYVIASIPNVMNATVILDLLAGNFTYRDEGILDRTHLRFFTLNEIKRLFASTGYTIKQLSTTVIPKASTSIDKEFFDKLIELDGVAPRELFDIFQFIVKASC